MSQKNAWMWGLTALLGTVPVFAEGEAAPAGRDGNLMQTFLMIAVALVFFYFILWRPEQKRRKQMDQLRSTLKKGDRVTVMGILGTVVKIQETTVILSIDGAKMEVLKAAITDVQAADTEDRAAKPTIETEK